MWRALTFHMEDTRSSLEDLQMLRKLREEMKRPVAALLDTKGPEIRLKEFASGKVELKNGQTFTLTTEDIRGR